MKERFPLIAAPVTPMRPDGSVDLDTFSAYAQRLRRDGSDGVFVCGTTGEFPSLTLRERMQVAEAWRSAAGEDLRVIVHVGHTCAREAAELAAHAQSIGANGIGAVGPFFFKPASIESLVASCEPIAAAAPKLRFYYYHIPMLTGVFLPAADFLAAAAGRIPNLAGVKFTHDDLLDFGGCVDLSAGRYELFFGRDDMLLAALATGATGAVGGTYNYSTRLVRRVVDAFQAGDIAAAGEAQAMMRAMMPAVLRNGIVPAVKAIMALTGLECGPSRPPLMTLDDSTVRRIGQELESIGFFAACRG